MPDRERELEQNLAAQLEQLREARARVGVLREAVEDPDDTTDISELPPLVVPDPTGYDELTQANHRYLGDRGRIDVALEDLLGAEDLGLLRHESVHLGWTPSDIATVGLFGVVGTIAAVLEGTIDDQLVRSGKLMGQSELVRKWERETSGLPIDYMGHGTGGPRHHRMTSAGHDIGRPTAALRQIVEGRFEGTGWSKLAGRQALRRTSQAGAALPYQAVPDPVEAAWLWVRHLVTDVITPTSLPLPGWTKLYELAPTHELAQFLLDMYWHTDGGPGWNVRTLGVTKMVPLVVVEIGIRSKLSWDAYTDRGELALSGLEGQKRDEMLLAAHGVVSLVTTGRVVIECLNTGPVGLRGLNPQVIARTGQLGVRVLRANRDQRRGPADWETLAKRAIELDLNSIEPVTI